MNRLKAATVEKLRREWEQKASAREAARMLMLSKDTTSRYYKIWNEEQQRKEGFGFWMRIWHRHKDRALRNALRDRSQLRADLRRLVQAADATAELIDLAKSALRQYVPVGTL